MAKKNFKLENMKAQIRKTPKHLLGDRDLLSPDLPKRVGNLADRTKITIRLDSRIIEEAKLESKILGVNYQKLINDRLLSIYLNETAVYLNVPNETLSNELAALKKRIDKLEKKLK